MNNQQFHYSVEEKSASNRYSSIKSRVKAKKNISLNWTRAEFIKWYVNKVKKCFYCECEESEIKKFHEINFSNKRKKNRGKSLEIERLKDKEYSEKNCELVCYWCNNAKSDVFTSEQFKPIGLVIGQTIRQSISSFSQKNFYKTLENSDLINLFTSERIS